MGDHRAVAAEQATRRAAGGRPARAERHFLGAAHGRAVASLAKGIRPADDLLQRFVRWRKAEVRDRIMAAVSQACDGDVQMIDSTSVRVHQHAANSKKATRIAAWAAPAAG
jgi:transposase